MNSDDVAERLRWECEKCGKLTGGRLESLYCSRCGAYASRFLENRRMIV